VATYLTHAGKKHKIDIPSVTLRTHKMMLDWSSKLDAHVKQGNQGVQLAAVRKMLDTFPEALDFIDAVGNVNSDKLQARMDYVRADEERKAAAAAEAGNDYTIMSDDDIRDEAYRWVTERWQQWIKDNPAAALMLMFQATDYPTDYDSLLLGIECIKATVLCDVATKALIDGDLESDFWQDVDAAEVADYCTRFLTAYKARRV
jgi:hypothetical protein